MDTVQSDRSPHSQLQGASRRALCRAGMHSWQCLRQPSLQAHLESLRRWMDGLPRRDCPSRSEGRRRRARLGLCFWRSTKTPPRPLDEPAPVSLSLRTLVFQRFSCERRLARSCRASVVARGPGLNVRRRRLETAPLARGLASLSPGFVPSQRRLCCLRSPGPVAARLGLSVRAPCSIDVAFSSANGNSPAASGCRGPSRLAARQLCGAVVVTFGELEQRLPLFLWGLTTVSPPGGA